MSDQIDYTELRRRVEERLKRDKSIARVVFTSVNAMMFFLFMLIGWWILLSRSGVSGVSESAIGAMVMLSAGWGTGLFMQVMSTLIDSGRLDQTMRAQAAAREMGRMIAEDMSEGSSKRKRDLTVSLSDDGELIEAGQEESEQKRATGARS